MTTMGSLQLVIIIYLTYTYCSFAEVTVQKICKITENGKFWMSVAIDLGGKELEYITFLDGSDNTLKTSCSTSTSIADAPSEFTGDGTAQNPYNISLTVDPANLQISSPNCGHSVSGNLLTWKLRVVHTVIPIPNSPVVGDQFDLDVPCDFDTVTENPTTGVTVNGTIDVTEFQTVNLTHTSAALEMLLIKEDLEEYTQNEVYRLGDIVRLRIRVLNKNIGLYGANCKACNSPTCDDLIFPLLDHLGCKTNSFRMILGQSSSSRQTDLGTYMIGHIVIPFISFSQYAGMAFTEEFKLFKFVDTDIVFVACNVGYCESPEDPDCVEHCEAHINGRKKRDTHLNMDRMMTVIKVEGKDDSLLIDYPKQEMPTVAPSRPIATEDSCLEKPEYIGVLGGLGVLVVGTSLLAMALGIKFVRMEP